MEEINVEQFLRKADPPPKKPGDMIAHGNGSLVLPVPYPRTEAGYAAWEAESIRVHDAQKALQAAEKAKDRAYAGRTANGTKPQPQKAKIIYV